MQGFENSASPLSGSATTFDPPASESETGNMIYTILTAENDELIELVNLYISEGWEPLGGIAIFNDSPWFSQAMIRPRQRGR
jgi:hypothetical protein